MNHFKFIIALSIVIIGMVILHEHSGNASVMDWLSGK